MTIEEQDGALQEQEETTPALEGIQDLAEETEQVEQPEQPIQETPPPQDNDNVRRLRQAKQKAENERDEAMRFIDEFRRNQAAPKVEPEPEEELNIDPEDLASGKHILKIERKFQKMERNYQEQLGRIQQQSAATAAESQLRSKYPDIDKVINSDTVAQLREQYPEIAASINSNPDVYSKSVAAYTMIKRLGLSNDQSSIEGQARLQQNASRPRSSSAVTKQKQESPLSQANSYGGLTKEMKAQAARELAEILGS